MSNESSNDWSGVGLIVASFVFFVKILLKGGEHPRVWWEVGEEGGSTALDKQARQSMRSLLGYILNLG